LLTACGPRSHRERSAILRDNVEGILLASEEEMIAAMRTVWERMKISLSPRRL